MKIRATQNLLSLLAIIISGIALITSCRSCAIADKAHQLNVQQYNDKFKTLWKGSYDKEKEVFSISPTNKEVMIQRAKVYYPDEISTNDWPIDPPEYYLYFTSPKYSIESEVKKRIKSQKGYTKFLGDAGVPVIIESYYTINGVSLYDKSLYVIEYNAIIPENEFKRPSIGVKGLVFWQRLNPEIEPKSFLNESWKKGGT